MILRLNSAISEDEDLHFSTTFELYDSKEHHSVLAIVDDIAGIMKSWFED